MNKLQGTVTLCFALMAGSVSGGSTQPFDGHRTPAATRPVPRTPDNIAVPESPAADGQPNPAESAPTLDLWSFDLGESLYGSPAMAAAPQQREPGRASTPRGDTGAQPTRPGGIAQTPVATTVPTEQQGPATVRNGALRTRIGAQKLAFESLIHKDRNHRGAVAALGLGTRTEVRGFVIKPDVEPVPPNATESHADDYSLQGMLLEHGLALHGDDTLELTGGWVSGKRQPGNTTGNAALRAASAWSLGGRANLLAKRLRLSFEYAGSRRDMDPASASGTSSGLVADASGHAYQAGAEYRSIGVADRVWHMGTEYSWVGPQFGSVANPTLNTDRLRTRSYGGVTIGEWLFDVSLNRSRNNLLDNPTQTTTHTSAVQFTTTWTPAETDIASLFGAPRFRLFANLHRNRQLLASLSEPDRQVEQSAKLRFESEFRTALGSWGIKAMGGRSPGAIDAAVAAGVRTARLELYGDFNPRPAPALKPTLSWQQRVDRATGTADERWRAAFQSGTILLHNALRANLDVGYVHQKLSKSNEQQTALTLGGRLAWTLQRPGTGRNGLALTLSGSCVSGRKTLLGNDASDDYRLMLSLSTSNPLAGW